MLFPLPKFDGQPRSRGVVVVVFTHTPSPVALTLLVASLGKFRRGAASRDIFPTWKRLCLSAEHAWTFPSKLSTRSSPNVPVGALPALDDSGILWVGVGGNLPAHQVARPIGVVLALGRGLLLPTCPGGSTLATLVLPKEASAFPGLQAGR